MKAKQQVLNRLPLRSHSGYLPGTQRRKWVWTTVDRCSSLGKSGCPGSPRTTAHMGKVVCPGLASAAALTSDSSCGFYTLVLLLSHVTGRTSPNKRCNVLGTCYSRSCSQADTNMHNTFTPSCFLTRMFQGAVIV